MCGRLRATPSQRWCTTAASAKNVKRATAASRIGEADNLDSVVGDNVTVVGGSTGRCDRNTPTALTVVGSE
jgi:hypothetical protein